MDLNALYRPDRIQRKELWEFIRLIPPSTGERPDSGWKTKDAIGAYCLLCEEKVKYRPGTSEQIHRHMREKHEHRLQNKRMKFMTSPNQSTEEDVSTNLVDVSASEVSGLPNIIDMSTTIPVAPDTVSVRIEITAADSIESTDAASITNTDSATIASTDPATTPDTESATIETTDSARIPNTGPAKIESSDLNRIESTASASIESTDLAAVQVHEFPAGIINAMIEPMASRENRFKVFVSKDYMKFNAAHFIAFDGKMS